MTREETVLLTRYIKACCPQQAIDRYTPDAWHDLLGEFDVGECRAAAAAVARRQPFVAPSEIIAEVERARRAELGRAKRAAIDAQQPPAISPAIVAQNRREPTDPRPLRESIRAILSRHGRPELAP